MAVQPVTYYVCNDKLLIKIPLISRWQDTCKCKRKQNTCVLLTYVTWENIRSVIFYGFADEYNFSFNYFIWLWYTFEEQVIYAISFNVRLIRF